MIRTMADRAQRTYDPLVNATTVISEPHTMVHKGFAFHASGGATGIAPATTTDILIVTSLLEPHMHKMHVSLGQGDIDIGLNEGATTSDDGLNLGANNLYRSSTYTSDTQVYVAPIITDYGTTIYNQWVPPTEVGVGTTAADVISGTEGEEWILKPNTKYVMRIANNSGSTINIWYEFIWYEVINSN